MQGIRCTIEGDCAKSGDICQLSLPERRRVVVWGSWMQPLSPPRQLYRAVAGKATSPRQSLDGDACVTNIANASRLHLC